MTTGAVTVYPERPSLLDRALRIFSDVRPGEGATVLLMFANLFLLLTSYYVIKVVSSRNRFANISSTVPPSPGRTSLKMRSTRSSTPGRSG